MPSVWAGMVDGMRVLCSFAGRAGDILWALPTVRAVSEHFGVPVDFQCCGEFVALLPLLAQQPYLGTCYALEDWPLVPPAEWNPPRLAGEGYDRVYHLGYRGWPQRPLPYETLTTLRDQYDFHTDIDLDRPWITVEGPAPSCDLAVGFTTEHFELKLGILLCVAQALPVPLCLLTNGGRWTSEVPDLLPFEILQCGWVEAACAIKHSDGFFGDCSALHVLAVALGVPAVIVEPNVDRHQAIFWPLGQDGRVRLVRGNDRQPTIDARHCADTLREVLRGA